MREMAMNQAASDLVRISPNGTKVRTIPATVQRFAPSTPLRARLRVAAYARVSTDEEEQLSSYEAQVDYYTRYIQSNPEWTFVEVYADEGLSGTNTRKRRNFNRMIDDVLAGKIDRIVTKSVSRFARNTVDTLTTIRKLKEKGVGVLFIGEDLDVLIELCDRIMVLCAGRITGMIDVRAELGESEDEKTVSREDEDSDSQALKARQHLKERLGALMTGFVEEDGANE